MRRTTIFTLFFVFSLTTAASSSPDLDLVTKAKRAAETGDHAQAVDLYGATLDSFDENTNPDLRDLTLIYRAHSFIKLGRYEDALIDTEYLIETNGTRSASYHVQGTALLLLNRYPEAIASFNKAVSITPDYVQAISNRGVGYCWQKDVQRCKDDFLLARSIDPSQFFVDYNLGVLSNEMRNFEDAVNHFSKAIESYPELEEAYFGKGTALLNLGRAADATKMMKRAEALGQDLDKPFGLYVYRGLQ